MTDALAQPYPDRIAALKRSLDITRQSLIDADHALRIRDTEVRRLRSEASELMAENAGLIQCNDQLKRDKAWLNENAKQQAERIRGLEAVVERLHDVFNTNLGAEALTGQHDLPPTRADDARMMSRAEQTARRAARASTD